MAGKPAYVAQNDNGGRARNEIGGGLVEIGRVRARYLGEGCESPFEIIGGGKQRLRLLAALACDKAHAPALRLAIEKIYGTRRVLARNFQPRDLIAKIERKIECRFAARASTRAGREWRRRQDFAARRHGGNLPAPCARLGLQDVGADGAAAAGGSW